MKFSLKNLFLEFDADKNVYLKKARFALKFFALKYAMGIFHNANICRLCFGQSYNATRSCSLTEIGNGFIVTKLSKYVQTYKYYHS